MGGEEKKKKGRTYAGEGRIHKRGPADVEGCGGLQAKNNRSGRMSARCGRKGGGVGAFRMAGGLRGGMRTQCRWSRVSWDGTGREWEGRVCDHKAPGEATGEPGGI